MFTFNFKRRELKFMLDVPTRKALLEEMASHMVPDEFGESEICNIYYDTPNYLLVRRSIEHPVYKEKLRLRSYGQARPQDSVFLELKKKCEGIVYKRRAAMSQEAVDEMLQGHAHPTSQIERELDFSIKRYSGLAPKVYIAYARQAYFGKDDCDFRMTFDSDIRMRQDRLSLQESTDGALILPYDKSILEIKTCKSMPLWLVEFVAKHSLFKTNWSKYAVAYQTYIVPTLEERSFAC